MNKLELLALGNKPKLVVIKSLSKELWLKELSYKGVIEVAQCTNAIDRALYTLIYSVCNEDGKLIFDSEDKEVIAETFTFAQIQEIAYEASNLTSVDNNSAVK
ncbi:hypothetical protein [Vibrio sp. ER1A]|uniref:hypothetical protein n=1 Tax=Vibrio sp. ER1A TaxID=1517681 RepID=UPI0004DD2C64|nr:hypothetical protein [Vibrio sp. ER1A]KFA99267.1 hypothetical protein HW45_04810 [Vibrio sp. ER1A]